MTGRQRFWEGAASSRYLGKWHTALECVANGTIVKEVKI